MQDQHIAAANDRNQANQRARLIDNGLPFWYRESTFRYMRYAICSAFLLGTGFVVFKIVQKLTKIICQSEIDRGNILQLIDGYRSELNKGGEQISKLTLVAADQNKQISGLSTIKNTTLGGFGGGALTALGVTGLNVLAGAKLGAAIDFSSGGLTFGVPTLIGAALGAGLGWFWNKTT